MESIVSSVLTGFLALIGVIITTLESNKKIDIKLEKAQAITDCKLEELTREVRNHNNFAEKIPVLEEQIKALDKKIEKMSWKKELKNEC